MSSTRKVLQKMNYGKEHETNDVDAFIVNELRAAEFEMSNSDTMDQSRRIDELQEMVARLVDILVQSNTLSLDDVLKLTRNGYMRSNIRLIDE